MGLIELTELLDETRDEEDLIEGIRCLVEEDAAYLLALHKALPALLRVCRAAAEYREAELTHYCPHTAEPCETCERERELDAALAEVFPEEEGKWPCRSGCAQF